MAKIQKKKNIQICSLTGKYFERKRRRKRKGKGKGERENVVFKGKISFLVKKKLYQSYISLLTSFVERIEIFLKNKK